MVLRQFRPGMTKLTDFGVTAGYSLRSTRGFSFGVFLYLDHMNRSPVNLSLGVETVTSGKISLFLRVRKDTG